MLPTLTVLAEAFWCREAGAIMEFKILSTTFETQVMSTGGEVEPVTNHGEAI